MDIVRTNVRAILQRVWRASEVDNLRLCRVFSRVFNRLLWSHGQGLWNCFSNLGYVCLALVYHQCHTYCQDFILRNHAFNFVILLSFVETRGKQFLARVQRCYLRCVD